MNTRYIRNLSIAAILTLVFVVVVSLVLHMVFDAINKTEQEGPIRDINGVTGTASAVLDNAVSNVQTVSDTVSEKIDKSEETKSEPEASKHDVPSSDHVSGIPDGIPDEIQNTIQDVIPEPVKDISEEPSEPKEVRKHFDIPQISISSAGGIDRITSPIAIIIGGNEYRLSLVKPNDETAYSAVHILCPVGTVAIYQSDTSLDGHAKVWCTWNSNPVESTPHAEPHPAVSLNELLVEAGHAEPDCKNSSFAGQAWAKRIGC